MSRRRKKIKNNRGQIALLIVIIIALIGFALAGGFSGRTDEPFTPGIPANNQQTSTPKNSLQINTVNIISVTPTPTPGPITTNPSQPGGGTGGNPNGTNASARIVRGNSGDRTQFYPYQWAQGWQYSSCSGFSMMEVMNAWGTLNHTLIAGEVLLKEQQLGVYTVPLGITTDAGFVKTANAYNFNASTSYSRSLQQVIDIANSGTPVIVAVRGCLYNDCVHFDFTAGHIMVIKGGNSQYVFTVDSSMANIKSARRASFSAIWNGLSSIFTPR